MMRKRILSICFVLCLVHMTGLAQHYVGAMMDATAAWHLYREDNTTLEHNSLAQPKVGAGVAIGGVYQFQYDKFLLQTGLMASEAWLRHKFDTIVVERKMKDTEGYDFIYRGELYDRVDCALLTEVSVPLMLGANVGSFYILAGAKCVVTVYGLSFQKALLNTKGDYGGRYYGVLENMPQHGFYSAKELENKSALKMRPDVRLCAELGWVCHLSKYSNPKAPKLQVGAFVEYGVANPLNKVPKEDVGKEDVGRVVIADFIKDQPYEGVDMIPIYSALYRNYSALNNVRVGIRVTALFHIAVGTNVNMRHMF